MTLDVHVDEQKPGYHVVTLVGRLDTNTHGDLEQQLDELLKGKVLAVRFDMWDLNYISSMGIRVLLKTFKALRQRKAMFLAANLQPQIEKVLEIAAALPSETLFRSVAEADEYFDRMQQQALEQQKGSA